MMFSLQKRLPHLLFTLSTIVAATNGNALCILTAYGDENFQKSLFMATTPCLMKNGATPDLLFNLGDGAGQAEPPRELMRAKSICDPEALDPRPGMGNGPAVSHMKRQCPGYSKSDVLNAMQFFTNPKAMCIMQAYKDETFQTTLSTASMPCLMQNGVTTDMIELAIDKIGEAQQAAPPLDAALQMLFATLQMRAVIDAKIKCDGIALNPDNRNRNREVMAHLNAQGCSGYTKNDLDAALQMLKAGMTSEALTGNARNVGSKTHSSLCYTMLNSLMMTSATMVFFSKFHIIS